MRLAERITADPEVMHGRACIKGTRIPVSVILGNLADGVTEEEIIKSYPSITPDDIRAAISYASQILKEREVV